MQKKLLVLALAAAFSAPAFAETTVYGIVDAVVANVSADGMKSDMSVHSGGLGGSRLGVKASEDLANGMKASIVLEYGLDVATDSSLGNARQELVSIGGDFGTVAAGYLQSTGYDFSRFDPTSGSLVSPLHNITGKGGFLVGNNASLKRLNRALGYTSPDMGGVTIGANYSTAADAAATTDIGFVETSTQEKATAYLVSANYVAGSFAAAAVYANNTAAVVAPSTVAAVVTKESALGASYDLGMAKLFATYQTNKKSTGTDSNTVMSVSAAAPFGDSTVVVTYATADMKGDNVNGDADVSGYSLVYLNKLSKTTTFYASYNTMSQGTAADKYSVANNAFGTTAANGADSSMLAAGVSKKF